MSFRSFCKDHLLTIILFLFADFLCFLFLLIFKSSTPLIVVLLFTIFLVEISSFLYEFFRRKAFYDDFSSKLLSLDQKYLITEILEEAHFFEGRVLVDSLYDINKSMLDHLNQYKGRIESYKSYLEMWIHEIKIPLSNVLLHIHNQKGESDAILLDQIKKLEDYMDQILYYSRGEYAEVDYFIKECSLKSVINHVILRNKDSLLYHNVHIHIDLEDKTVLSDSKWLEFILNQIIINSVKYKAKNITFSLKVENDITVLSIKDDGIGILKSDLPLVFEKSFTGKNGRHNTNSTGMGLYICHNLCKKLGHSIEVSSEVGKFTKVTITFLKQDFYDTVR